jgi:hypothetical protein
MNAGNLDPLVEIEGRWEDEPTVFRYHAVTIGAYYRLIRNLKVGAFYRLQRGMRHDDDWVFLDPGYNWAETKDRSENVLILDASPRFLLDFLPGRNWVFMLKARYLYNTFNDQQTVTLRPGITYFLMKDRRPLINFSFSYELYLPLNYGSSTVYAQWPYLEVVYHASDVLKPFVSLSYRTVEWSTSEDVREQGEPAYDLDYRAFVIGGGLNLDFDL